MSSAEQQHDVFISYAHVDNEPLREGDKGWVEQFHRQLHVWLRRVSGDPQIAVWRDPALRRAELFDVAIEQAVRGAATMIALLTPTYLKRDYCQQELTWFREQAESEPAGLVVEGSLRVLPVLLYDLPLERWPAVCAGTSAFRFHEVEGEGKGLPLDPGSTAFQKQLQVLATELWALLEQLRAKHAQGAPEAPAAEAAEAEASDEASFTVFLSHPSYGLEPTRRQLKDALSQRGIRVTGDIPPPHDEEGHARAAIEAIQQADLSVHLLGALPGEPINSDDPDKTFPLEQARLGLEHARSQLILLPEEVQLDTIQAGHYVDFIRSVGEQDRETERLELVTSGRRQMLEQILGKQRRLEEAARRLEEAVGGGVGTAFIDLHMKDVPHATDLLARLAERNVTPMMIPSADGAPTMGPFEEQLKKADLFIVVFGSVSRTWVERRLEEALKLIVTNRLPQRPAVYLAPPEKAGNDTSFAGIFEVLDGLDKVDRLLEQATRARA